MASAKHDKKKKKSSPIITIIIFVLIAIIAFCAYKIGTILYNYHVGTKEYKEAEQIAGDINKINWDGLTEKYKDIKAWIYLEDTVINYPVAQGTDNDYYLYRLIGGEYNVKGTLFIDCRNQSPFENDFLTIIYGHRMKDKSMFWILGDFREQAYFDKHRNFILSTPSQDYDLEIFAACTIPSDSPRYAFGLDDAASRQEYIDWIKSASEVSCDATVTPDDKIVMLSTCTYEYDNARAVIFGKLTPREGIPDDMNDAAGQ